jgi:hypothetical protein
VTSATVLRCAVGVLLSAAAGCAGPVPAQRPPDPVEVCTDQLVYWAGEELRSAPDVGFDYQHMGLTAGRFDALRAIVDEARVLGAGLPADLVPDRARAACAGPAAGTGGGPATS